MMLCGHRCGCEETRTGLMALAQGPDQNVESTEPLERSIPYFHHLHYEVTAIQISQ
jgi:hypothetical protein